MHAKDFTTLGDSSLCNESWLQNVRFFWTTMQGYSKARHRCLRAQRLHLSIVLIHHDIMHHHLSALLGLPAASANVAERTKNAPTAKQETDVCLDCAGSLQINYATQMNYLLRSLTAVSKLQSQSPTNSCSCDFSAANRSRLQLLLRACYLSS